MLTDSVDGRRAILELREGSLFTGLIVNDTPESLAWAEEVYRERRTTATSIDALDVGGS